MKIRYFAWVRERVGLSQEEIDLPEGVVTAGDLMAYLSAQHEGYAAAFAAPDVIRVAIDQEHAESTTSLASAQEVAFFPPMTGG